MPIEMTCEQCQDTFFRKPYRLQPKHVFCSTKCSAVYHAINRPHKVKPNPRSERAYGLGIGSFKYQCDYCGHWNPEHYKKCENCGAANLDWYDNHFNGRKSAL